MRVHVPQFAVVVALLVLATCTGSPLNVPCIERVPLLEAPVYLVAGAPRTVVLRLSDAVPPGRTICPIVEARAQVLDPFNDPLPVEVAQTADGSDRVAVRFTAKGAGAYQLRVEHGQAFFQAELLALDAMLLSKEATLPVRCSQVARAPSGAPLCLSGAGQLLLPDAGLAFGERVVDAAGSIDGVWLRRRPNPGDFEASVAFARETTSGALQLVSGWSQPVPTMAFPIATFEGGAAFVTTLTVRTLKVEADGGLQSTDWAVDPRSNIWVLSNRRHAVVATFNSPEAWINLRLEDGGTSSFEAPVPPEDNKLLSLRGEDFFWLNASGVVERYVVTEEGVARAGVSPVRISNLAPWSVTAAELPFVRTQDAVTPVLRVEVDAGLEWQAFESSSGYGVKLSTEEFVLETTPGPDDVNVSSQIWRRLPR